MTPDPVAEIARRILRNEWVPNCAVDVGTKKSIRITKLWQQHICSQWPKRYQAEFPVGRLNEKIDLVDLAEASAYELKVSPNNTHFEFYRDIFKVWIHNADSQRRIKKLRFITPQEGARRVTRGLAAAVTKRCGELGFAVEVVAI
jgi:hypothetical protein